MAHGDVRAIAATELPDQVDLSAIDPDVREVIETCLRLIRERLGMQIAWLGEFHGDREIFRVVEGEREEWDLWDEHWLPATGSYCQRMLDGRIGNVIPDTAHEPEVATLQVTDDLKIVSYVGVPLLMRTGELRGAFCCARNTTNFTIDERDVRYMQVLARLVADELAFREAASRLRHIEAQAAGAQALLAALRARDGYTGEHSTAVVELATDVAGRLGLDEDVVAMVEQVALLHDVGKVGIPDAILLKAGPLDDEERRLMREHPAIGSDIVARIRALSHLRSAIRAEHEQWDGGGYPDGLAGEAIPVASRITLACDAFHAMVSDRPYRAAMSQEAALAELRRCSGTMFWPAAVAALADGVAGRC